MHTFERCIIAALFSINRPTQRDREQNLIREPSITSARVRREIIRNDESDKDESVRRVQAKTSGTLAIESLLHVRNT